MMRATASKDVQHAARAKKVPRPITAPAVPYPTSHLQRKACACGGTCPRCRDQLPIQTKLTISEPGDQYEQEADRIADQVLAAPPHLPVNGAPPRIQRLAGQRTGQPNTAPASVHQTLASSGRPLEPALRQDMEQRFGYDFSRVRLHTGVAAEQSARDVNAKAYTVGHDVVFGARQFGPGTTEGRRLLVHELTHVVQQSGPEGIRLKQSGENRGLSLVHLIQQGAAASLLPSGSECGRLLNTAGIGSQSAVVPVADAERLAGRIDTHLEVGTQMRPSVTLMRSGVDPERPDSKEFLEERPPKFRGVVVGSWDETAQLVAQERLDTSFPEPDHTRAVELAAALRAPSVIMREWDRLWIYTLGWEGLSAHFSRFTNASTIFFLASPKNVEAGVYSVSNVIGYEDVEAFVTEDGGVLLPPGAGKLYLHTGGEFEETVVSAGQNAGAFIGGLAKGLSDANFAGLAERLQSMTELNTVFPLPFTVGALHGIANEIVDFLKLLDWEHLKAIEAAFQQTVLLLIDPDGEELAASLGEEVGRTQAASMDKLLEKHLVTFAYEVGKLVGPTIVEIVLAFLGYEVGPLKLLSMALDLLKKAPKLDGVLRHATDVFADTPDIPRFPRKDGDNAGARSTREATEEAVEAAAGRTSREGLEEGAERAGREAADADRARGMTKVKPTTRTDVVSLEGQHFSMDFRRDLSGVAQSLVRKLDQQGFVRVDSIHPDDLVAISKWFGKEIGVLQTPYHRKLRLVLGTESGILKSQVRSGEVFVVHTHPVFRSQRSHFGVDIPNAGKHTEAVVDWSGQVIYFNKQGVLNPPTARGESLQSMPASFQAAFMDAEGRIVGYSKIDVIVDASGKTTVRVVA